MTYLLLSLAAILVCFIAVLVARAAAFKPKNNVKVQENEEVFDRDVVISRLAELVKCKTISYGDKSLEDNAEFDKLIALLPKLYPNVFKTCEYKELPDRALLFCWKGKTEGDPAVLMAHYDVVPVNEDMWDKPPFEAVLEDGVLSAAEHLIETGFTPESDIYFAFSGGEEVNGKGALNIVNYFEEKGINPAMVVDEGGAVVENVFPGVKAPCGLIGIAEKGMMNVEYSTKTAGGHASAPKPHTPVGILSKACCRVEAHPFKHHITPPVAKLFDTLGRHSSFVFKIVFSNIWLFKGLIDNFLCIKKGGEINALMRTTVAFTQMEGSKAPNVIPPRAAMVSNMRLNPMDNIDSAMAYLKKVVNDDNVEIKLLGGMNPSRISTTDCEGYDKVATAVASTWKGCIVSPYLMVQCSDSRHWGKISDKVYRFSAMDLTSEERATIHGNNERIRVDCACRAVEFYIRLIKQC